MPRAALPRRPNAPVLPTSALIGHLDISTPVRPMLPRCGRSARSARAGRAASQPVGRAVAGPPHDVEGAQQQEALRLAQHAGGAVEPLALGEGARIGAVARVVAQEFPQVEAGHTIPSRDGLAPPCKLLAPVMALLGVRGVPEPVELRDHQLTSPRAGPRALWSLAAPAGPGPRQHRDAVQRLDHSVAGLVGDPRHVAPDPHEAQRPAAVIDVGRSTEVGGGDERGVGACDPDAPVVVEYPAPTEGSGRRRGGSRAAGVGCTSDSWGEPPRRPRSSGRHGRTRHSRRRADTDGTEVQERRAQPVAQARRVRGLRVTSEACGEVEAALSRLGALVTLIAVDADRKHPRMPVRGPGGPPRDPARRRAGTRDPAAPVMGVRRRPSAPRAWQPDVAR